MPCGHVKLCFRCARQLKATAREDNSLPVVLPHVPLAGQELPASLRADHSVCISSAYRNRRVSYWLCTCAKALQLSPRREGTPRDSRAVRRSPCITVSSSITVARGRKPISTCVSRGRNDASAGRGLQTGL